ARCCGFFNGGTVTMVGTTYNVTGTTGRLVIAANGSGAGNGGNVSMTFSDPASTVVVGTAALNTQIFANGGSTSSVAGDGGKVTISVGANLIVDNSNPLNGS